MSQRLDSATDVIGLVQVVQANKARQIPSSEQVSRKCGVGVDLLYFIFRIGWMESRRNIGKGRVFDFVVVWEAVEGSLGQMDVNIVSFVNRMGVGRRLSAFSPKKLSADQASVHVRASFQGDGTRRFEIEIQAEPLNSVEIGTGNGFTRIDQILCFPLVLRIGHSNVAQVFRIGTRNLLLTLDLD